MKKCQDCRIVARNILGKNVVRGEDQVPACSATFTDEYVNVTAAEFRECEIQGSRYLFT